MKLDDERESRNLEDRRGQGGGQGGGGRGIGGGARIGGLGLVAVVVISLVFGVDPGVVLSTLEGSGGTPPVQQQPAHSPPREDAAARFVSRVLASTEDVWTAEFAASQQR